MNKEKAKEAGRMLKFALFSVSAGLIEMGSYALLAELTSLGYWPCYLIALTLSVLWNFTLNRKFTFRSAANVPIAMLKVAAYYAVFTPLSTLLGEYLTGTLHWNGYLATVVNMLLNFVTEYLYQRFFVFGPSLDGAGKEPAESQPDIDAIMALLDWNQSAAEQQRGKELARRVRNIQVFLQPCHENFHKNVWDNCAEILTEKTDEELSPYLSGLMEWLQDMNWPGAGRILERLRQMKRDAVFRQTYENCRKQALAANDDIWEENLKMLDEEVRA